MLSVSRVPFAAPGVYRAPEAPLQTLTGVRMDVCGFAGVAARGPARRPVCDEQWPDTRPCTERRRPRLRSVAVAVESFDEYRRWYGGFEGPGLMPYAVASFFEQGGRRAWIARIVHDYDDEASNAAGVATGVLPGVAPAAALRARNEGAWGNALRATLELGAAPAAFVTAALDHLVLSSTAELGAGSLLRLALADGSRVFRFVDLVECGEDALAPRTLYRAYFDAAVASVPDSVECVEAAVDIDDGDGRHERLERVGLHHAHPRWLAQVLCYETQLAWPDPSWADDRLTPESIELVLPAAPTPQFRGGEDRYADIVPSDVVDTRFLPEDEPGDGVNCFAAVGELSTLCIPDLYSPAPLPGFEPILDPPSVAGATFERCVDLPPPVRQAKATYDLAGLRRDPRLPSDLKEIVQLQQDALERTERLSHVVLLLDVPPGLSQREMLAWRAHFDSAYAAAYHPWLTVARRDDSRDPLIHVPPSAIAAGIIARTEILFGVPHGPANALAYEVVSVDDRVSSERHDELHPFGINVYLQERDGVRLTAARTLSRDPQWRQLSVRRLVSMLARSLERQMQWSVFEPNGARLRLTLTLLLRGFLRRLFAAGAFKGATEDEAFFVDCDAVLNAPPVVDAGRVIAEIGVAPAEPVEFIVLRLSRDGDGTLTVEE
ncbi:MAG TPA: phage tail sheath C-terminal domain-containing protein [Gammaproteobacteria bacterium]|nr:phage tail sheath C-terminal domain-containing protein [Gammaproteobacteria bacterium]